VPGGFEQRTGLDVEHRERVTHGVMPGGASLG